MAKRFFNHDTYPAFITTKIKLTQVCGNSRNQLRSHRHVENYVGRTAPFGFPVAHPIPNLMIGRCIAPIHLQVADMGRKLVPLSLRAIFTPRKFIDSCQQSFAVSDVSVGTSANTNYLELIGQVAVKKQIVERRREFAKIQVAAAAKDEY